MKIYIIPVNKKFQPKEIPSPYPAYNSQYGVEQDFLQCLVNNPDLVTQDKNRADLFYLPIFWTRWHINHDYGNKGLAILQKEINKIDIDKSKMFTICQYDDGTIADVESATVFLSSRKNDSGIDIPLLSSDIFYDNNPYREYLASFSGRLQTHPIRWQMEYLLQHRKDVIINNGDFDIEFFARLMLNSKIALCPRGYGGSSFRFYEAMQFGTIPLLIGEKDVRPFKRYINWDECSFYLDDVNKINEFLDSVKNVDLKSMSKKAIETRINIAYQNWCRYVLMTLEDKLNVF
jgi:hypothetical protein